MHSNPMFKSDDADSSPLLDSDPAAGMIPSPDGPDGTTTALAVEQHHALPAPRATKRDARKATTRPARDLLLELAASVRTFRGSDGRYYGALLVRGNVEYYRLDSHEFRRALIRLYDRRNRPNPAICGRFRRTGDASWAR